MDNISLVDVLADGAIIRRVRRWLRLTQIQLARRLGLNRCSIIRWERETFEPTRAHRQALIKLCQQRGLDLSSIKTGDLLSRIIGNYDPYTRGHNERVAMIASMLSTRHIRRIVEIAAFLHDTGKIAVPLNILTSTNKLSTSEYAIMKQHTGASATLIEALVGKRAARIAGRHHERLDAKGYNRIPAYQISQSVRIITVADIFDALTSTRSYRKAMRVRDALRILKKDNGLDQNVVARLEKLCRNRSIRKVEGAGHQYTF